MMPPSPQRQTNPEDPPPFFHSWNRLYTAVLAILVALMTLFYFFAQAYR